MTGSCLYPQGRLLVFGKAPVPGRVKSRLAPAWGPQGACRAYQHLFCHTLTTAVASRAAPVELWCSPGRAHPWLRARAVEAGVALHAQPPGDLGRRMHRALTTVLQRTPFAVIIGADCAGLAASHLRAALTALDDGADAVFGPADDGGYVLVGLRRPEWSLFGNVPWGTGDVMDATRRRMRRLGWDWVELPATADVDRPADVRRLRRAGVLGGLACSGRGALAAPGPGR
ncbi:MAG: TIGR04282 family arsenosugar biosynthesis glycosyltransferase [Ectothiorhodospiraceae bacterium]